MHDSRLKNLAQIMRNDHKYNVGREKGALPVKCALKRNKILLYYFLMCTLCMLDDKETNRYDISNNAYI